MKLNNKGFTLVEVLAAIVIITILGIIADRNILGSLKTSKEKSYEIVVENIVTASKELFEEVYANKLLEVDDALYHYDDYGNKTTNKIEITDDNKIETNLQTLVSNGFLSTSNNKILLNPKTDEEKKMGDCKIEIIKTINLNKVTYEIKSPVENGEHCPTDDDYKKGVK